MIKPIACLRASEMNRSLQIQPCGPGRSMLQRSRRRLMGSSFLSIASAMIRLELHIPQKMIYAPL